MHSSGVFTPRGGGGVASPSSSSAKAGDPVFRDISDGDERSRFTDIPHARGMTARRRSGSTSSLRGVSAAKQSRAVWKRLDCFALLAMTVPQDKWPFEI